jgi:hypothetical protein
MSTAATKKRWVNFKELRSQLKFAEVLKHYGVSLTMKGDQATGGVSSIVVYEGS